MNIKKNNEILKSSLNQQGILRLTLCCLHNHNALSEEMMFNIGYIKEPFFTRLK